MVAYRLGVYLNMDQYQIESHLVLDGHELDAHCEFSKSSCGIIVGITVVFSMDKDNNKIVIESLEEWCEFMLNLCESKVDNDEVPIMSKPAASYSKNERGNFWGMKGIEGVG